MPMLNTHLISTVRPLPPQSLMDKTYAALKSRVRKALLENWADLFPTPEYYVHPPSSTRGPLGAWASLSQDGSTK